MKIITLTLNPAIDMHCYAENFEPFHENLAKITSTDAGGKGVNISRALTLNGVDNLALVVLGSENGKSFADRLGKSSVGMVNRIVGYGLKFIKVYLSVFTENSLVSRNVYYLSYKAAGFFVIALYLTFKSHRKL